MFMKMKLKKKRLKRKRNKRSKRIKIFVYSEKLFVIKIH